MCRRLLLFLVLVIGLSAGPVWAEPITIENYGWEDPPLADDGQLTNWPQIPGWDGGSGSGIERKWYGSTEGNQCAFFGAGAAASCYQLTDHSISAGENFTLTFDAIMSWDGNVAYAGIYYDAAGERATVAEETYTLAEGGGTGEWGTYTLSFSADDVPASVGNKIGIEFYNADADGWIGVDNARLEYEGGDVAIARNPSPGDGATGVSRDVVFSWTPGQFAVEHDVYIGTNFNDVNDATTSTPVIYIGRQDPNYYPVVGVIRLEFGQTYYWRIDEVNAPPDSEVIRGRIWSFTVEPAGYPIPGENITATASSGEPNKGPENTVNRSGLDESGLLHGNLAHDTMWLSSGEQPAWIKFEFDKPYKLHEMWVWNFNDSTTEPSFGLAVKDVLIEYSLDDADYTTLRATEFAQAPGTVGYEHEAPIDLEGVVAKYVRLTVSSNWGGFVTKYGLSEVRFFYIPVRAREPNPQPETTNIDLDVTLSWKAGREAAEHNVYLSTDEQAVTNGTAPMETVVKASYGPLSLNLGETYYWRVDEANDSESPDTWQGDIWNFTTEQFLVVDDFESYNADANENKIWYWWKEGIGYTAPETYCGNGTGAAVGDVETDSHTEETIVRGGSQSMPYNYNNSGTGTNICGEPITLFYSEAELTFSPAQDWARGGAKALSLWFYGDPYNDANATEQLYVKLNGAKVTYDGDLMDMAEAHWHEWNIDLTEFGVDVGNVNSLAIGFGDETNTTPGGSGKVYFDDISMYPSRCVASRLKPAADLNDDCVVDYLDIEILARDWLLVDDIIPTAAPSTDGLVAHWMLDGNTNDSSGNNNFGTLNGGPRWISAGQIGGALALDGTDDYVDCGVDESLDITGAITVSAWVSTNDTGNGEHNPYLTKGDTSYGLKHYTSNGIEFFVYDGDWYQARSDALDSSFNGIWHHVAGTYDGSQIKLYIDGGLRATTDHTGSIAINVFTVEIGRNSEADDGTRFYEGAIDDARIYSRALSEAELAYLADTSPDDGQLYVGVPSRAELYEAESEGSRSVNVSDFAVLADQWLDELLWPQP